MSRHSRDASNLLESHATKDRKHPLLRAAISRGSAQYLATTRAASLRQPQTARLTVSKANSRRTLPARRLLQPHTRAHSVAAAEKRPPKRRETAFAARAARIPVLLPAIFRIPEADQLPAAAAALPGPPFETAFVKLRPINQSKDRLLVQPHSPALPEDPSAMHRCSRGHVEKHLTQSARSAASERKLVHKDRTKTAHRRTDLAGAPFERARMPPLRNRKARHSILFARRCCGLCVAPKYSPAGKTPSATKVGTRWNCLNPALPPLSNLLLREDWWNCPKRRGFLAAKRPRESLPYRKRTSQRAALAVLAVSLFLMVPPGSFRRDSSALWDGSAAHRYRSVKRFDSIPAKGNYTRTITPGRRPLFAQPAEACAAPRWSPRHALSHRRDLALQGYARRQGRNPDSPWAAGIRIFVRAVWRAPVLANLRSIARRLR